MKRRLFTILSGVSLLLFVATIALWVRSHHRGDRVGRHQLLGATLRLTTVESQSGTKIIAISRQTVHSGIAAAPGVFHKSFSSEGNEGEIWRAFTVEHYAARQGASVGSSHGFGFILTDSRKEVWFPHWFLAVVLAILPAVKLITFLRTRSRNRTRGFPVTTADTV